MPRNREDLFRRGRRGVLSISPRFSSVSSIWCTEGGVTLKYFLLRWRIPVDFAVVMNEGQVLPLLLRVFRFHITRATDSLRYVIRRRPCQNACQETPIPGGSMIRAAPSGLHDQLQAL